MLQWISIFAVLAIPALAQNAEESSPDLAAGKKIFESQCALCHGQTGTGGRGPGLHRRRLEKAPDDETLRKVISEGIEPEMPGAWQLHPHEVVSVAAYVRSLGAIPPESLPGDATRGEEVYRASGCGGCHMIAGRGEGFGPELTAIGERRSGAYLKQTLLHPAESLPEGFLFVEAVTESGDAVRGIRVNEDSFTVQIKDARGHFHSFRKSELRELRKLKNETPMPSYERSLRGAQLDDLVAYLAGLRGRS